MNLIKIYNVIFKAYKVEIKSLLIFLTSSIYFLLAYKGYKDQNIELETLSHKIGKIDYVGIDDYRIGSKGWKSKILSFMIDSSPREFGVYRQNKNYNDLVDKIKLGETIKIYYKDQKSNHAIIDVVQIEKGGEVILSQFEFEKKQSYLIWIGLIAGIGTIMFAIYYYVLNSKTIK